MIHDKITKNCMDVVSTQTIHQKGSGPQCAINTAAPTAPRLREMKDVRTPNVYKNLCRRLYLCQKLCYITYL